MTIRRGWWAAFTGIISLLVSVVVATPNHAAAAGAEPMRVTAPTVTINQASFQSDPTKGSLIYFTVRFNVPVTGFTAGDVSLTGSTAPGDLTAFVSGSGTNYTVWIGGMTGPGKVIASIPAGVARDTANNSNQASTSTDNSVTYKPSGPTVAINQGADQFDPTNTSPIVFDVVFSTAVTGFSASDISFTGSTVGGAPVVEVSGTGANYAVSVSGITGKGTLVASIPAGAARDASNNNSFASTSTDNAVDFDNIAPLVTINQAAIQADPALTSPILFTVSFSEPVTGFSPSDISFAGSTAAGTLTASLSGAGQTYTVSVTGMTTSGTVIATIPVGAVADSVGNTSAASTSTDHSVTYSSAPTVTINQTAGQTDPTRTGPIAFAVVFSLPVTGFDGSDISFAGSTVGGTLAAGVAGGGANYTVSVTGMTGSGTVVASVPAGAAVDAANKPNVASSSNDNSVTLDALAPTVTIDKAAVQSDPTGTSPILFAVTFSEPVTGFTASDVSFAGSTVAGALVANVSGSGASYTVSVGGMTSSGNVAINIPAGAAQDQVGNGNQAPTLLDSTVAFDNVAPTVTIEQAVAQSDPTGTSPIVFTVTFSEAVNNFTASDVSFAGSTAGGTLTAGISGAGGNYNISVTGMTTPGTVIASIPLGAAQDAAGNANQGSTSTDNLVAFDNVAPTVVINQAANQADPTSGTPIVFTVAFSEPVTGFNANDVLLTDSTVGGALLGSLSGSGANYTVSVSGMSGTGAVIARVAAGAVTDTAGNSSAASTSTDNVVTYLPTGPTVTINQAGLQTDPTNTAPLTFSAVFSAPVTGFDGSDISFAGSTVPGSLTASVTGSGANYTVTVTGMSGAGVVAASIPAGAAVDGANNSTQASTSVDNHVTFDNVAPTAIINQAVSQQDPTGTSPIAFSVTFAEPVTGFNEADVSFGGSTVSGTLSASVSGTGANYTVSVAGMTSTGVVVVSIRAGAATDAVGNASAASTSSDNSVTFDNLGPTATINQAATQADPANTAPIQYIVTFSEPVVGFTPADVSFAGSTVGGTLAASVSGTGASYTISVTGMNGSGTVLASIPAGAVTDLAGNVSAASTSSDNVITYSPLGPTVTINQMPGPVGRSGQSDPTNASPIMFSAVFSAPVTGFSDSDVNFTGSTVGGSLIASVSGSGTTYTVSVTGMSGNGTVVASIPADAAVASAGGGNRASTSTDNAVTFDTTPPTVTINQAPTQIDPANASPIQFTVTFSELVVGFNASDVSLAGSTIGGTLLPSVTGSGANYTVSVTGMIGTGTVVASVPAAAAKDAAGNNNLASASTDNTVTFGTTGPTVTINQAAGQPDPTNGSAIQFTVVFSSPVTGFAGGDLNFAGSTVGGTLAANVAGTGAIYTVSVTGMTGTGTVVASIPAGAALDGGGNVSAASSSSDNSVAFDNIAPTVTINQAAGQADPTNASPILFSVVFSEAVGAFAASDVSFTGSTAGGTLVATVNGSGANYTVSVDGMTGTGTVVATIPAGAATDAAGNASAASTSTNNTVTYNGTGPTVTINQATGQADPTKASPIQFTVVFGAPVTGFTNGGVSLTGTNVPGNLVVNVTGSGATYTVSVSGMTGTGNVVASIPAGAGADTLGNPSQASSSTDNIVAFDNIAPTVTINQAAGQADPTNASPIQFTVVFSEVVTGFNGADVSFAGSTVAGTLVANVSGGGANYTVSVTGMTGTGTVVASIPAGAVTDAATNASTASTSTDNAVTYNATGPSVTINQATGQADPTNASPIQFTVVFSAPVTGFTAADINLASSTAAGTLVANLAGSGASYAVSITGMTGAGAVVATIPAGAAVDAVGNPNTTSSSTDNSITFDNVAPTVTINQAGTQIDPTNTSPVLFTVVFSEPVTGFATGDVVVTGSTVSGTLVASVTGSGANYTVSVTGMTGTGNVIASIPAAAANDAAGNPSIASTSTDNTVTFNNLAPAVTINQAAGQSDPTNTSPVVFTAVFSAPVTGFTSTDVSLADSTAPGTLAVVVTGSGMTYSVSVSGMTAPGNVVVSIPAGAATDAANNLSQASTSADNTITFDNVVPTVTIDQASGQTDPTNQSPVLFSVVFSEPVVGFTGSDVFFTGSTVGGTLVANVTGSGANYSVSVSGMSGSGTVVASVPAGRATDPATNPNNASTSTDNSVAYNAIAPTVTINQAFRAGDPTNTSPIAFTVLFSAPVTGFTGSDISFTGSTAPGTLVADVTGSGAAYTVSISGMTGSGTVQASIPAGAAQDAASNLSQASTSIDNTVTYDNVPPTVTINQAVGQADPTNVSPIVFTVVFSESVNGFIPSDVSLNGSTVGGTLVANVSGSGANYTVSITGMSGTGTVVASIPGGAATDLAGNSSTTSTSTDNSVTYNVTGPTVTINQATGQPDSTNASPIQFTVIFNVPVTGFTGSDVSFAGSTLSGLVASVTGSGSIYTVSVTGMTGTGNVIASIPAGAATDTIGNPSAASSSTDNVVTFDNAAPTVTIDQASGQADQTNVSPITFAVTFSEAVTGFTSADVSLAGSTVGGTLTASVFGGAANYIVSVTGMTGAGTVVASIPAGAAIDAASNPSAGSTSTDNTVTYNAVAPTVTIDQATGQADPTSTSPILFTVVFSVPVTGFTASDVSFTGSSAPGIAVNVTGSGTTYTVSVSASTGSGTVVASIPAGAASDQAGNLNQPSTSADNSVTYDLSGPRVVSASPSGIVSGPIDRVTLAFNEAIQASTFTLADVVSLTGPGGAILPTAVNALNSQQFEVLFPSQASGTFTLVIGPDIRDLVDNQMDQNANGVNGESAPDRYTTSFTIAGVVVFTSVTPLSGQQGQTNLDVVVNAQFSHFVDGVTTAGFSGNGISVNSVRVTSPTSATLNIDISPLATADQRSVTLTTNTELVSSAAAGTFFSVTASPATIASITPNHGRQAETLPVSVTGFATHFATGSTSVSFGAGITVNSFVVNSPTSLDVNITIHPAADVSFRTVIITTAGESATSPNGFTVNQGTPMVTTVSPATAHQTEALSVAVDALFTHFDTNTQPDFGAGISVNSIVPTSATRATVNITIDHDAAPGSRTVIMRTGLEEATKVGAFTVLPAPARLLSITPVAGVQGTTGTLIVNGDFTHFTEGVTAVSVGSGITFGTVTVNGPALLSVPFTIFEWAPVGARDVIVVTSSEVVSLPNAFTVIQGQPGVTVIDPNAGQRGISLNVSLTGHFTNWTNGVTHVSYGPGITVNSNVVSSPTQITTNITIDADATLGPRNVAVTTNSEVLTVFGGFTVNDVDITAPALLTVSPAYGMIDVPLNVVATIEMTEPLDRSSVSTATIQLWDGFIGEYVPSIVTLDVTGRIITVVPSRLLAVSRPYTLYIGWNGGLRDVAGNQFGATYSFFTTGFATDTTGPTLMLINPPDGEVGVPLNAGIAVKFDRPINAAARAAGLQILKDGIPIAGTFTFADELRRINFAPAVPWDAETTYTIALSAGLIDLAGNSLTNPGIRTFTTGTAADVTAPFVTAYSPSYGDTNVGLHPIVRMTFSEPINAMTTVSSTFYLYNNNLGVLVPTTMTISPDRLSAALTPTGNLNPFTQYFFYASTFYDVAGNYGGSSPVYFTTGGSSDAISPTVLAATPAPGTANVPVNALVQARMSEVMDPTSIDHTTLQLTPPAAGTVSLLVDRQTIRLTLSGNLTPSTAYRLNVSGARDSSGNVMTPFSASFTTLASAALDTTAPTVLSFSPTTGSTDVPVNSSLSMTLSEPIDPSHVGPDSMGVYVNNGTVRAGGTYAVSSDGTVVTFTPATPLPPNSVVYFFSNLDFKVTDFANNQLQYNYTSFTTGSAAADTTTPTVISVTPVDATVDVGPLAVVTLTFSESMSATVDVSRAFAVFAGGVPQSIGISRSADYRMVFLSGTWPLNTLMTVVATGDNTDFAGNHLTPFSSTFTTAAAFDPSRPYIVTQLPTGSGVDRATPITMYVSKPLNTATVSGAVYVSQNGILVEGTIRTPGGGTAINFTPAAPFAPGAVIQVFVTAAAQDTFGNAIFPFSGSFIVASDSTTSAPVITRTSPSIATSNNPLNTVIEVEFSEPLNPATVTMPASFGVYLRGAGSAIPGALSLTPNGRTIRFVPDSPLEADTYYYVFLQSGLQDVQGTPLVATAFYFYLGHDSDTTTPTVASIAPTNGSINVGINASIRVAFSEPINPLSLTPESVTLSTPAGPVPVTLVLANNNMSLRIVPQSPLPANTLITVSVDPEDLAGHEVPVLLSQFTTGSAADTVAPVVVAASWTNGQTGVAVNSVLELAFSEAMDIPSVLSQQTFVLYDGRFGTYVAGTLTASGDARTFMFTPASALAVNRPYSFQMSVAQDLAGNVMTGFNSSFMTSFAADHTPPAVVGVNPLNGAADVPRNAKIRVLFDEPIAADSLGSIRLLRNGNPVAVSAVLTNGNRLATLTATGLLSPNSTYTVSAQVRDASGNDQTAPFVSTFTTGNDVDLIAPTYLGFSPQYGQSSVPLNAVFRVALSEAIDPLTIESSSFLLYNPAGQPPVLAEITIAGDRRSVTLTPTQPLLPYTQYFATLYNYSDSAGNLGAGVGIYFLTGGAADATAPAVSAITPSNSTTDVPVNARLLVVMSEGIDPTSVTNTSIQVAPSVAGTVTLGVDQVTLTFTPAAPLSPSTSYTVTVSGLRDLAAHTMAAFTSNFTTSSSSTADTIAPTIVSIAPVNGAAGVAVNSSIVLVSTEPITRSVVGPATMPVFALLANVGYVQVAGTYTIDSTGTIVTFAPTSPYPANTTILWYTNYTGQITDFAGNPLQSQTAQFTTGSTADTTTPMVLSITPTDGSTGLGPYTTITLTFSESVSPASINDSTLALFNGAARLSVGIARSLDNRMAFLSATLAPDSTYTVTGTSDILDLSGNALAPFTSSFTTAPFDAIRPSIVSQRPTGSGVRPTTSITLYTDSALNAATVPGAMFVSQNGVLLPGTVTVSGAGRVILFTPAAPFAPGSVVEINITESATDPSRNPVFPYFGQFLVAADPATVAPTVVQTSPIVGTSDNPQNSVVDLEFSEPLNPATVTDGSFGVYLFGTGSPITGARSLRNGNRTIHFVPDSPLQAEAYYYVYLTSDMTDTQGTALAATNFYFYVGTTTDASALAAPSIAPSNGASGVGVNALGILRFNEPINPTTINSTTVTLTAGSAVPFVLSHLDNKTFYVTPQAPLPASSAVTLSVSGAEDLAGHVAPTTSATFTTALVPDTVRPSVVATSPTYGTADVPVNAVLQVMFDEPIDPGGVPADLNCLLFEYFTGCVPGGTAALSADGRVWTYVPAANLTPAHSYWFGPSGNLLDLAGNPLNASAIYFVTSSETDTSAPQVLAVSPPALSDVPRNALIEVLFNEPIRATAIDQVNVLVGGNRLPIAARTLSNANRTLTITLTGLMTANTVHTIAIAGISDVAGNLMPTATSSFTTGSSADLSAPSGVVVFTPIDGTVNVPVTVSPSVRFSEPMNPVRAMSLSTGTLVFFYQPAINQYVSFTLSFSTDYRTLIVTPTTPLQPGTQYVFGVYYGESDLAGNQSAPFSYITFTTQ